MDTITGIVFVLHIAVTGITDTGQVGQVLLRNSEAVFRTHTGCYIAGSIAIRQAVNANVFDRNTVLSVQQVCIPEFKLASPDDF